MLGQQDRPFNSRHEVISAGPGRAMSGGFGAFARNFAGAAAFVFEC